jgi:tetratricopeptide (TPR) repeat protein
VRALLLILIPMLALAGVMSFVFWIASDRNEQPQVAASPISQPVVAPQPRNRASKATTRPALPVAKAPGTTTTKVAQADRPVATSQAIAQRLSSAAEAIDDWASIARSRAQHSRDVQLGLARQALATSRPAEAIAACDHILAAAPDDVEALSAKALALHALGRLGEAASTYEQAIKVNPEDLRLRYNYAVILSRLRVFGEATRNYEFILKRQPDHARAMYNLAVIYQDDGKLTDAAKLWERITTVNPDLPSAWVQRGTAALQLGDYETAAMALERADKLEPGKLDICTNLGTAYQGIGRLTDAIAAFRRAQDIRKDWLPAVNGMAEVYLTYFEKHPEAADQLECALQWCEYSFHVKPDQPRLADLYQKVLKAQPDSIHAVNGLARVLAATKPTDPKFQSNREQAIELCKKSLALKADQPEIDAMLKSLTGG